MNTLILANLNCEILIMLEEDAIEVDIYIAYISAMWTQSKKYLIMCIFHTHDPKKKKERGEKRKKKKIALLQGSGIINPVI